MHFGKNYRKPQSLRFLYLAIREWRTIESSNENIADLNFSPLGKLSCSKLQKAMLMSWNGSWNKSHKGRPPLNAFTSLFYGCFSPLPNKPRRVTQILHLRELEFNFHLQTISVNSLTLKRRAFKWSYRPLFSISTKLDLVNEQNFTENLQIQNEAVKCSYRSHFYYQFHQNWFC